MGIENLYASSPEQQLGNRSSANRSERHDGQSFFDPCAWRPDPDLRTEQAQQWSAESQHRRNIPIELSGNGCYEVRWGDSLSTIAERNLRTQGMSASRGAIDAEVNRIVELNQSRYSSLDCNSHYIKEGWMLQLPRHERAGTQPPAQHRPPVEYRPAAREYQPPPRVEYLPPNEYQQPSTTYIRIGTPQPRYVPDYPPRVVYSQPDCWGYPQQPRYPVYQPPVYREPCYDYGRNNQWDHRGRGRYDDWRRGRYDDWGGNDRWRRGSWDRGRGLAASVQITPHGNRFGISFGF